MSRLNSIFIDSLNNNKKLPTKEEIPSEKMKEGFDNDKNDKKKLSFFIPYAFFMQHLKEKMGIGDEKDFIKRKNAINRYFDNEEIRSNIQVLGNKAKADSLPNAKQWDIFNNPEKSKDYWKRLENDFRKSLKSNNLNVFESEKDLLNAMEKKNFVSEVYPEYNLIKQEANNAMNNFSKKGQKLPFKDFHKQMKDPFKGKSLDEVIEMNKKGITLNKNPRLGLKNATKKFNLIKSGMDILTNPKLNSALAIFFTPTPLHEPSYLDIKKNSEEQKLSFNNENKVKLQP